jgi:hypothetical protein
MSPDWDKNVDSPVRGNFLSTTDLSMTECLRVVIGPEHDPKHSVAANVTEGISGKKQGKT